MDLHQLFGFYPLTSEGTIARSKVEATLKDLDSKIGDLLKEKPEDALALLLEIGGNLFLLKNVDFELLRKIDKSIIQSMKIETQFDTYTNDSGWWYYLDFSDGHWLDSTFSSWDDTFVSFDSGYDAAGCSSHDSGCSSCGGCSGCGGCGGCS